MKTVRAELASRLVLLDVRHSVVFGGAPFPSFDELAETLEAGLRSADPAIVGQVRGVVDPGDLDRDAAFWSTSLGRLLFVAGGYGAEYVTQAFVAGLLGCSRQYVYELMAKGRLSRSGTPAMAHVEQVRELLKMRLDDLVK